MVQHYGHLYNIDKAAETDMKQENEEVVPVFQSLFKAFFDFSQNQYAMN